METQKILSRDFLLCFFAQFAFAFVFCILIPTFPIYLSSKGSSNAEIGLLIGIFSVASLLLRPFVGRWLLRIPERKFMVSGAILYIFSAFAYLFANPFWPLFVARILHGIGLAFFSTSVFTLIANISPVSRRGQSLGYFHLSINIAFVLAPYVGMLLINQFSFTVLFLVCAGLSLCAFFITLRLTPRQVVSPDHPAPSKQSFLSREALPPSIMAFMVNIIWGALMAFFPLYAVGQGVSNPGLFFGVVAIIHVIGRGLGARIFDLYSREKLIFPCLIAYIISMSILAFSRTLPMFILVAVIWGLGNTFLYPTLMAYTLDRVRSSPGPAMATFTAIADLGAGMGSVIMGIVLQFTNYPTMFLCLTLTSFINLLYFYTLTRKKGGHQHADL